MASIPNFNDEAEKLGREFLEMGRRRARRSGFEDVDDAAQQISMELWRKRVVMLSHANPAAYTASITGHRMRDILGAYSRRQQQEVSLTRWDGRESAANTSETGQHVSQLPAPLMMPDRSMELAEARRTLGRIDSIVKEFSTQWQHIFEQCLLQQRPHKEVAEELELAPRYVSNEVVRIKKLLRERCG